MPDKLTIYEIKERIENSSSSLVLGWETENHQPRIISKGGRIVAYPYHQKWIVTSYACGFNIWEIIEILERWDGVRA